MAFTLLYALLLALYLYLVFKHLNRAVATEPPAPPPAAGGSVGEIRPGGCQKFAMVRRRPVSFQRLQNSFCHG